jgi:hypothetical protein
VRTSPSSGIRAAVLVELFLEIGPRIQGAAKTVEGALKLPEARRAYCESWGTEHPIPNPKTALRLPRVRSWCALEMLLAAHNLYSIAKSQSRCLFNPAQRTVFAPALRRFAPAVPRDKREPAG